MNRRFSSGRNQLIGRGIVYPVPIPLDPVVYEGTLVNGRDPVDNRVKLYYSDGISWQRDIFDTEIVEQIERFIDDLFLNGFDEENLPDATLPENLRRYLFNNTRGLPAFAWGGEWKYLTDEARVAEIADEVAFNAVRVVEDEIYVTVHRSDPAADYASVGEALDYFTFNMPASENNELPFRIHILSGHFEDQQIIANEVNYGAVRITADDAEVMVVESALTRPATAGAGNPYMEMAGNPPVISCVFRCDGSDSSINSVGLIVRNGYYANGVEDDFDGVTMPPAAGFTHFRDNIQFRHSSSGRLFEWSKHTNARRDNVFVRNGAFVNARGDMTGAGRYGCHSESGSAVLVASNANCRKSAGTDSADDIRVSSGGYIDISAGSENSVLGGISQVPLVQTNNGMIVDRRISGRDTVIQRGSNANGVFVRFADGTQICWKEVLHDFNSTSTISHDYAAAFSSDLVGLTMSLVSSNAGNIGAIYANELMLCSVPDAGDAFRLRSNVVEDRTISLMVSATGRWL